jgi:hypothetical protein
MIVVGKKSLTKSFLKNVNYDYLTDDYLPTLSIIRHSKCVITPRSATSHIAAAYNIPALLANLSEEESDNEEWLSNYQSLQFASSKELFDYIDEKTNTLHEKPSIGILIPVGPSDENRLKRLLKSINKYANGIQIHVVLNNNASFSIPSYVNTMICPDGPKGIVAPTKYGISRIINEYEWIIRLNADTELMYTVDFHPKKGFVYGPLREQHTEIETSSAILSEMLKTSIPIKGRPYIDGWFLMSEAKWWKECYLPLPPRITHYADEAIACAFSVYKGWQLVYKDIARHGHGECG